MFYIEICDSWGVPGWLSQLTSILGLSSGHDLMGSGIKPHLVPLALQGVCFCPPSLSPCVHSLSLFLPKISKSCCYFLHKVRHRLRFFYAWLIIPVLFAETYILSAMYCFCTISKISCPHLYESVSGSFFCSLICVSVFCLYDMILITVAIEEVIKIR